MGLAEAPNWTVVCHNCQVVAFNPVHNVSDWAAFRLRREDLLRPIVGRDDRFRCDPEIPKPHRVVHSDYTKTGYDRGHLAPAAAMKWSGEAMKDSFLMTNIAPQIGPNFNRGIWKTLELKMRQWACQRDILYVVTGPLYETRPVNQIVYDKDGDGEDDNGIVIDVPSHFFKLAVDPGHMEAIAFILPNRQLNQEDLPKFLTSIDDIEVRSRLDFMQKLWDGSEQAIESHVQPRLWKEFEDPLCEAID